MTEAIRKAEKKDASRLAEILIFTKRCAYRPIFQNDTVSFQEMQVLDLALAYRDGEEELEDVYVYDDGIVRAMMKWVQEKEEHRAHIEQLYVDPFFQGQGIGDLLMQDCIRRASEGGAEKIDLWVLEKNRRARRFYEKHGFSFDGGRGMEPGTTENLLRYSLAFTTRQAKAASALL